MPVPCDGGGLELGKVSSAAVSGAQTTAAQKTKLALQSVKEAFSEYSPYIPLGNPANRARSHKRWGVELQWTGPAMVKALHEFYVTGTFVPLSPEVCILYVVFLVVMQSGGTSSCIEGAAAAARAKVS